MPGATSGRTHAAVGPFSPLRTAVALSTACSLERGETRKAGSPCHSRRQNAAFPFTSSPSTRRCIAYCPGRRLACPSPPPPRGGFAGISVASYPDHSRESQGVIPVYGAGLYSWRSLGDVGIGVGIRPFNPIKRSLSPSPHTQRKRVRPRNPPVQAQAGPWRASSSGRRGPAAYEGRY